MYAQAATAVLCALAVQTLVSIGGAGSAIVGLVLITAGQQVGIEKIASGSLSTGLRLQDSMYQCITASTWKKYALATCRAWAML